MALPKVIGTPDDDADLSATGSSSIFGLSGNDKITGSNQADQIFAGGSTWRPDGLNPNYQGESYERVGDNDTVDAGEGDDVVYVGTGTDDLDGGGGLDQLNFYGEGFATFYVEAPGDGQGSPPPKFVARIGSMTNVKVDLIAGTYVGQFLNEDGEVVGKNSGTFRHFEAVLGSLGRDTILGTEQNDQIKPIKGNDSINGRGGFDILSYADLGSRGIVLKWGTGKIKDTFGDTDSFSNIEHVIGSKNSDDMNGTAGGQIFTGGAGKDTIDGVGGTDTLDYSLETGGKAINVLLAKHEVTDTFGGTDTVDNIENIIGTTGRDVMTGDGGANTFWGRDGKDNLGGGAGKDTLWGGLHNDALGGGDNDDKLYGEDGSDVLIGNDGDDTLDGGDKRDTLKGGDGDDTLNGGDGNDTLTDRAISENAQAGVVIDHKGGNLIDGGAGDDTIDGVGRLLGGADNDRITGLGVLDGGTGDDRLEAIYIDGFLQGGSEHMNLLLGGDGNDTLIDSPNNNHTWAMAEYAYASHGLIILFDSEPVRVEVGPTDIDTLIGVRGIGGTAFGDHFVGDGGTQRFLGRGGDDVLKGLGGHDQLEGGEGNDTLEGGNNDDLVDGGAGDDFMKGDGGDDGLYGGKGNDTIYGGTGNNTIEGGDGSDVIYTGPIDGTNNYNHVRAGKGADKVFIDSGSAGIAGGAGDDRFEFIHEPIKEVYLEDFTRGHDKILLTGLGIESFSDLRKLMDVKLDWVVIEFHGGGVIHIGGNVAKVSDLHASDFIL
ncbi:MAG: calcium-binding protein [Devosia sp.]